jgi:zinc transport system permease protein
LFGIITTVSFFDVILILILAAVVAVFIFFFYRQLFLVTFHEELAFAEGLNTKAFNTFLIVAAAIVVSLSMRIVGTLLIGALMVIPVVTSLQMRMSFRNTFLYSILFSVLSTVTGLFVSFYLNLSSGGTIVLVALCFFLLTLLMKRK